MMAWHKAQALEISSGKASFPPNEAKGLASAESSNPSSRMPAAPPKRSTVVL